MYLIPKDNVPKDSGALEHVNNPLPEFIFHKMNTQILIIVKI